MLLLSNCEVHTSKYSNSSFEVRTEQNEVHTKIGVQIFSAWNEKLVNKSFIV